MNTMLQRAKRMRNRKGFTLIELIVVIVIIGILAAVLIPRLTGFTDKAHTTQAMVWAKEVATAMDGYFAEHNDWPTDEAGIEKLSGVDADNFAFVGTDGGFTVDYEKNGKHYYAGRPDGDTPVTETDASGTPITP